MRNRHETAVQFQPVVCFGAGFGRAVEADAPIATMLQRFDVFAALQSALSLKLQFLLLMREGYVTGPGVS